MKRLIFIILSISILFSSMSFPSEELLPSWNDSQAKREILEFVAKVTNPDSRDFIPPSERIAVFDNDVQLAISTRRLVITNNAYRYMGSIGFIHLEADDRVSLKVRNDTSAADVDFVYAGWFMYRLSD